MSIKEIYGITDEELARATEIAKRLITPIERVVRIIYIPERRKDGSIHFYQFTV